MTPPAAKATGSSEKMTCTSSAAPTGRRPQTCSSGGIASRPARAEPDAALNHIFTFLHWPPVNPGRFGPRRQRPGGSNTSDVMGSVLGRPGQHGWRLRYPSRLTLVWRLANSTAGPSTSGGRFVCWLVGSTTDAQTCAEQRRRPSAPQAATRQLTNLPAGRHVLVGHRCPPRVRMVRVYALLNRPEHVDRPGRSESARPPSSGRPPCGSCSGSAAR
jgi:hypothetical protein